MLLECTLAGESWPLREPFEISRGVMTEIKVLVVRLRDEQGRSGYGEATGVPYKGETQATMAEQIEAVRGRLQRQRDAPQGGAVPASDLSPREAARPQGGGRAVRQGRVRPRTPAVQAP